MFKKYLAKADYASWLLRAGLAFVFLYAAISSIMNPLDWVGYVPATVSHYIDAMTFLKITEFGEVALAIWLLSGFYLRIAAMVAALGLVGIVVANPSQLIVTFRDVGLACTALALAVSSKS